MSGFLSRLAARVGGVAGSAAPQLPARFEAATAEPAQPGRPSPGPAARPRLIEDRPAVTASSPAKLEGHPQPVAARTHKRRDRSRQLLVHDAGIPPLALEAPSRTVVAATMAQVSRTDRPAGPERPGDSRPDAPPVNPVAPALVVPAEPAPDLAASPRRHEQLHESPPETVVRISIGRVDVRVPAPAPAPAPKPSPSTATSAEKAAERPAPEPLALNDYLRGKRLGP